MKRREFLKFVGRSSLVTSILANDFLVSACTTVTPKSTTDLGLISLKAGTDDSLVLSRGLHSNVLIKWKTPINPKGDFFGYNNDFIAFLPGVTDSDAYLWVNHEYVHPLFVSGYNPENNPGVRKTKEQALLEQKNVGGSFIHIKKKGQSWFVDTKSENNFRIDAQTLIPIISEREIQSSKTATGTLGNCSGGKTPWGTILTCEENAHEFYGDIKFTKIDNKWKRHVIASSTDMAWDEHYPFPPEHYGWVVEVDPKAKTAKKLTALGRFSHEGATVVTAADGRSVVYMGDDAQDQHFYKFIPSEEGSLEKGDLYVANLKTGHWMHLSVKNPLLKKHFTDQTDLLIQARKAAKLLGATPLDRPEACAQDPISKSIFLNCTMNKGAHRLYGSILKFTEENNDPLALNFSSEVFINGGELTGFACPDNMCFDKKGNLWITTDIADTDLNGEKYTTFGNNSLFYIPLSGDHAGKAFRFAIAPKEAEFTGPCFSEDGKTLFLSVQHPGATTKDLKNPTSHWPDGGDALPASAVVAISGPLLDSLIG